MSVADNIGYGLRVKGVAKPAREKRVQRALEMVRLAGLGHRRPNQLSGGQRQRVALARAVVNEPEVLLLDEPLGALDLKLRQEMQIELKQIQKDVGITFVYVTHDQEEALTMSDRLAVMSNGQIEQIGVPVDVYEWLHVFECLLRAGQLTALDIKSVLYRPAHTAEHRWADLARRRIIETKTKDWSDAFYHRGPGSTVCRSSASITRSASLPAVMEPLSFSSREL